MKGTNMTEAEAMIPWLQLPVSERSPLNPKQMELLERWNVADNLYREHMSERKIIPMLMDKFGYSESTARRDLDCARRVWGTRPRADKDYLANMLVDYLTESMVRAGKAQKFGEVARLADVIIKAAGIGKKDEDLDPEALKRPMLVIPMYDPELIGATPMDDAKKEALIKRLLAPKHGSIEDASYEELPGNGED